MIEIALFCEVALEHGTHAAFFRLASPDICEANFLEVRVNFLKAAWHQPAEEPHSGPNGPPLLKQRWVSHTAPGFVEAFCCLRVEQGVLRKSIP